MSAPTAADPNATREGLPARLRSAATMGRGLFRDGSRVLWTTPIGGGAAGPSGRSVGIGAAIVAAATGVSLLRQPGAGALNTVWAEDGEVFLSAAANASWVGSIRIRYAGYFHLGPRVLAELATLPPPSAAAATLAILAALCTALLAVLVYVASGGHL